ncbi:MAG: flagellar hook-basal body complex protein FliE [Peptococcaceae bacterium]|nr:flagellar hook-basal body complex protein FliE [Peptococcaceae bacterium]
MSVAPVGLSYIPIPPVPPLAPGQEAVPERNQFSFAEMLNNAIVEVNGAKLKADELTLAFLTGELKDYHTLAIALQESSLTMQMAIEVRNKVIEAYQEVTRMQV